MIDTNTAAAAAAAFSRWVSFASLLAVAFALALDWRASTLPSTFPSVAEYAKRVSAASFPMASRPVPWRPDRFNRDFSVIKLADHLFAEGTKFSHDCIAAPEVGVNLRALSFTARKLLLVNPVLVDSANVSRIVRLPGRYPDDDVELRAVPLWVSIQSLGPYLETVATTLDRKETVCYFAAMKNYL